MQTWQEILRKRREQECIVQVAPSAEAIERLKRAAENKAARSKQRVKETSARHYQENKEKILKQHKAWKAANKEHIQEWQADYYEKNKAHILEKNTKYYEDHKDDPDFKKKCSERNKRWREKLKKENPEKYEAMLKRHNESRKKKEALNNAT